MDGYIKHRITIKGDAMLMHNAQLADPLNEHAKAMKIVSGRRNKTEADYEELANLEFQGSLYLNDEGEPCLPSRVLEAVIVAGAKKTREGKLALSGVFADSDGTLSYEGGPLSTDELRESDVHRLTVGVRIQSNRVMRTRPYFKNWESTFQVSALESVVDSTVLKKWLENAGIACGVGDYRPRYGRFEVTEFEIL